MSNYLSEELAVVATIDPQLLNNNNSTSDWVDMSLFDRVLFIVEVGVIDTTVDVILREAVDGSGGTPANITGKSITQLAGTADASQVVLEVSRSELSSGCNHVACKVTVGNGSSGAYFSVVGLGGRARFNPASANDLASVLQIVA